jgi:hypothetical protein
MAGKAWVSDKPSLRTNKNPNIPAHTSPQIALSQNDDQNSMYK